MGRQEIGPYRNRGSDRFQTVAAAAGPHVREPGRDRTRSGAPMTVDRGVLLEAIALLARRPVSAGRWRALAMLRARYAIELRGEA